MTDRPKDQPSVRMIQLLALWQAAFASFRNAADSTRIGDMPGGGFDLATRIYGDMEKIIELIKEARK